MEREPGVAGFSPFLVLRLLMVSVTITIGVACGGCYSGGGAAVFALGECGEDFAVANYKVDVLCMHDF